MGATSFQGNAVTLVETDLKVGEQAPTVTVTGLDLDDVRVGGNDFDRVQVIISVPSLDTPTCAKETREFNQNIALLDICEVTVVSMDLPFAADKFCATEGIDNLTVVSDYANREFGNAYGVLMKDSKLKGLLARAVFVLNRNGEIEYKEIVSDVTHEPNYEAVLEAVKGAR
jgi:thiol peroxidase